MKKMYKNISSWISPLFIWPFLHFFVEKRSLTENNPSNPGMLKDSQSIGFWEKILKNDRIDYSQFIDHKFNQW